MYKKISGLLVALAVFSLPAIASAHVVVKPAQVGIGSFNTFTVGVPNEKDVDVTNIKLVLPAGLAEVSPTIKSGWTITTEKSGSGDDATTTSINWAGGTIPAGFRDDFTFSAQAPAKAADLDWKAYQTYADGTIVHWDQKPTGGDDSDGTAGPYSVTKVVNDLTATTTMHDDSMSNDSGNNTLALVLAGLALVVSVGSFVFRKK